MNNLSKVFYIAGIVWIGMMIYHYGVQYYHPLQMAEGIGFGIIAIAFGYIHNELCKLNHRADNTVERIDLFSGRTDRMKDIAKAGVIVEEEDEPKQRGSMPELNEVWMEKP